MRKNETPTVPSDVIDNKGKSREALTFSELVSVLTSTGTELSELVSGWRGKVNGSSHGWDHGDAAKDSAASTLTPASQRTHTHADPSDQESHPSPNENAPSAAPDVPVAHSGHPELARGHSLLTFAHSLPQVAFGTDGDFPAVRHFEARAETAEPVAPSNAVADSGVAKAPDAPVAPAKVLTKVYETAGPTTLGTPDGSSRAVATAASEKTAVEILVQFNLSGTAAERAAALAAVGGTVVDTLRAADGEKGDLLLISVDRAAADKVIEALSLNPLIEFAESNWSVGVQVVSNDPYYTGGNLWGMYGDATSPVNIYGSQAGEAWAANHLGKTSVIIGDIDTGIDYTHIDLYQNIWLNQRELPSFAFVDTDSDGFITFRDLNQSQNASFVSDLNSNGRIDAGDLLQDVRYEDGIDTDLNGYVDDLIGWDWVNSDNDPYDDNGHGTHTTGTIGATGFDGAGVLGVSPNVQVMALKFLSGSGSGSTANAVRAQDYYTAAAIANTTGEFIATSNSWGGGGYSQALMDSIVRAAREDILFVAAAGNNASNTDTTANYPSNYSTLTSVGYESVISVAATTSTGALASFSNFGAATVDLGAPGASIYSTVPGGGYSSYSGTSMATPHVAGALALYAAENPNLSAAQLRDVLLSSTVATTSLTGKTTTGGRLNVDGMFDVIVQDPTPQVYIAAGATSLNEGNSGATVTSFALGLNMAMTTSATVDWTLVGSGTSPTSADDFTGPISGTVTFAPGVTQQTVQISIVGDTTVEPNEQFTITLSNPSSGLSISQATATTTILNDEDDYPFSSATTGVVAVGGGASTGVIDFSGDADAFKVSLVAGTSYLFGQNSTSSLDPYLYLYDSNFTLLAANDDANGTLNSQIAFTASQTGTYYLGAKAYSTSIGSYSLNATVSQTTLNGTASNDTLNGTAAVDLINGFAGDDTLNGLASNDTINGGDGNDILTGGSGGDTQAGGNGSDIYLLAASADYSGDVIADTGTGVGDLDEVRFSGATADTFTIAAATVGIESFAIGTGSGATATTTGTTAINVNAGALTYGATISGNNGANILTGGTGNDILVGNAGIDTLRGGTGADRLFGGLGNDNLTGGAGVDAFVFNATLDARNNLDTIVDFSVVDDTFELENAVFTALGTATGTLAAGAFRIGTAAADADDRIIYNSTKGTLFYDSNGNASGGSVQIATLTKGLALTNLDFLII